MHTKCTLVIIRTLCRACVVVASREQQLKVGLARFRRHRPLGGSWPAEAKQRRDGDLGERNVAECRPWMDSRERSSLVGWIETEFASTILIEETALTVFLQSPDCTNHFEGEKSVRRSAQGHTDSDPCQPLPDTSGLSALARANRSWRRHKT
ncbi:hypothetical protein B0H19DRAFT_1162684 [Mycena capillaripes]|nr:hypothetical protein B0H19DRAFT_1162684 [Mycena capillaripes]